MADYARKQVAVPMMVWSLEQTSDQSDSLQLRPKVAAARHLWSSLEIHPQAKVLTPKARWANLFYFPQESDITSNERKLNVSQMPSADLERPILNDLFAG